MWVRTPAVSYLKLVSHCLDVCFTTLLCFYVLSTKSAPECRAANTQCFCRFGHITVMRVENLLDVHNLGRLAVGL